jgi:hypothetical protein
LDKERRGVLAIDSSKYLIDVKGDRIERIFAKYYPAKNPQALRTELIRGVELRILNCIAV